MSQLGGKGDVARRARMYADARPQRIYAGSNEVMKAITAKTL